MIEEAAIAAIALAIIVSTGVLAFKLGRRLISRHPYRWAIRLPVYFAGYHICRAMLSVVLVPVTGIGKGIFILNPIYALALKNTRAFEGLFASVLPRLGSALANLILLIIAVVVFSTSLWIIYRSIRIGLNYRALAVEIPEGLAWFWIGNHSDAQQFGSGV